MGLSEDPVGKGVYCEQAGKTRLSKSAAKSMAKRQVRRGRQTGNLMAYRCRTCDGWHVGNLRDFR